jgi:DNA gyrase/topoisomerase IV subunit B
MSDQNQYTEDNIRSLDWKEHIRMRPGMYIGKLGDGSSPDDGIYILLKGAITVSMSLSWAQVKRSSFYQR